MEGGVQHRVPLSDAAVAVLERAGPLRDVSGSIFPSSVKPGQCMSDMTLTKVLRSTRLAERATVHGFRSTFMDCTAEWTNAPHAVMELSLAHALGSSVEQAYARSDLIAKRRALMDQWARFRDQGRSGLYGALAPTPWVEFAPPLVHDRVAVDRPQHGRRQIKQEQLLINCRS